MDYIVLDLFLLINVYQHQSLNLVGHTIPVTKLGKHPTLLRNISSLDFVEKRQLCPYHMPFKS
jgi:hypothetical protein